MSFLLLAFKLLIVRILVVLLWIKPSLITGIYDEPMTPGQCSLVRFGDYLPDQRFRIWHTVFEPFELAHLKSLWLTVYLTLHWVQWMNNLLHAGNESIVISQFLYKKTMLIRLFFAWLIMLDMVTCMLRMSRKTWRDVGCLCVLVIYVDGMLACAGLPLCLPWVAFHNYHLRWNCCKEINFFKQNAD